jgi:hypothetical protein
MGEQLGCMGRWLQTTMMQVIAMVDKGIEMR